MRLRFERLASKATFGSIKTVSTDTLEGSTEEFVPERTLYCAFYQRTQNQNYQLLGTKLEDTIVIAVRSRAKVDNSLLVRLNGHKATYKILSIARDNTRFPDTFDLITLKDIEKVGDGNG